MFPQSARGSPDDDQERGEKERGYDDPSLPGRDDVFVDQLRRLEAVLHLPRGVVARLDGLHRVRVRSGRLGRSATSIVPSEEPLVWQRVDLARGGSVGAVSPDEVGEEDHEENGNDHCVSATALTQV